MKIGIVGFGNLSVMQYLFKYTAVLDREQADYDVIYWNRLGIDEPAQFTGRKLAHNVPVDTFQAFHKKIFAFFRYARFARRTIRKNRYDKLIVLTTPTATVLWDMLLGKYRGKYIYDYRDITKETSFAPFGWFVKKLIAGSQVTMMSSKGFLETLKLPATHKVMLAHNTHREEGKPCPVRLAEEEPIRIVYWGMVRQLELNGKLCDRFGNDPRFTVTYHGMGEYEKLAAYCREKNYRNIFFTGRYALEDVPGFVEQTDILHCLYVNTPRYWPAVAVKLYDALEFRLPILLNAHTHMAQIMEDVHGSLSLDLDREDIADRVYRWYRALSAQKLEESYAAMEDSVREDDRRFRERVAEFCR